MYNPHPIYSCDPIIESRRCDKLHVRDRALTHKCIESKRLDLLYKFVVDVYVVCMCRILVWAQDRLVRSRSSPRAFLDRRAATRVRLSLPVSVSFFSPSWEQRTEQRTETRVPEKQVSKSQITRAARERNRGEAGADLKLRSSKAPEQRLMFDSTLSRETEILDDLVSVVSPIVPYFVVTRALTPSQRR